MSVNVPSGVKDATHPGTSFSSAVWYALRMICSLSMAASPRWFPCSCDAHSAVDAKHLAGHPCDARVCDRDDPPSDLAAACHATERHLFDQHLLELRNRLSWYA